MTTNIFSSQQFQTIGGEFFQRNLPSISYNCVVRCDSFENKKLMGGIIDARNIKDQLFKVEKE